MEKPDQNQSGSMNCGVDQGSLPGYCASLAFPFVPMQEPNPVRYSRMEALQTGTLFPGLDLPFMNMVNQKEFPITPKTELQTLAFAINELALYLDTHRDDEEALEVYRQYQDLYHKGMMAYSKDNGPLNHSSPDQGKNYRWLDDPWPWEYAANKEA